MKSALVILATIVVAKHDHGFPKDHLFQSPCRVSATLKGSSCEDAKKEAFKLIRDKNVGDNEVKHNKLTQGDDWIRSDKLLDDQLFEFEPWINDCTVTCRSRSNIMKFVNDDGFNFCTMWNIASRLEGFEAFSSKKCKTVPDDPESYCKRFWTH